MHRHILNSRSTAQQAAILPNQLSVSSCPCRVLRGSLQQQQTRPVGFSHTVRPRQRRCLQIVRAQQSSTPESDLLKNKNVLITGASRGIGAAVAKELAKHSPTLILTADEDTIPEMDEVVQACRLNGASVVTFLADLSRPEGVELVARNAQQHGTVDVVVHAAAVYDAMTFEFGKDKGQGPLDGDPDTWDRQASLSYSAPLRLTRRLAPPMVEQGSGWIIILSSAEAVQAWPQAPAFASTKWALRGWTKSIYPILKEKGVHAITVNPPEGGGKLKPEEVASKLVSVFQKERSSPGSTSEEVTV